MKKLKLFLCGAMILTWVPFAAYAVDVERVISPGGIEAWLVQDHANPLVSMKFVFEGGSELDPKGKGGLANLVASTMDEGAGDFDSQAFQKRLADQSISLHFGAGIDGFSGQIKTLTKNMDEAFSLLNLAMTKPRFDGEPVDRLKSQILVGLRQASEDPGTLASKALFKGFFPGHGYGLPIKGNEQSVAAITREDLVSFVKTRLVRKRLVIGVVGDITPERLGALLDITFGPLSMASNVKQAREVTPRSQGRVLVIKKNLVQSLVMFGHRGLKRDDPDFYTALVMNYILGGGSFSSRLYTEVREKRGLAYSVGTYLYPLKHAGLIVGSAGTENSKVSQTVDIIRREWKRLANGAVTETEVNDAKTYLTGSFPLRLTSTAAIANVLVAMQRNDLGIDYLDRRASYIGAVTLSDVKRIAAKLLKSDELDVVIVGQPKGISSRP